MHLMLCNGVAGMLLGIAGNVMKQNAIAPPPKDPEMATEEEAGRRECFISLLKLIQLIAH